MPDQSLPNYPQSLGSRKMNVTTHNGPLAYLAGGETVNASAFGWGSFDTAEPKGQSFNANNTGNYTVRTFYPVGQSPATANNAMTPNKQIPTGSNSVVLKWYDANNNEAANNTNLTSEFVRMEYIGG